MGRPKTERYKDIGKKLEEYIEKTDLPIIAEFCYLNGITKQHLYRLSNSDETLSDSIKRAVMKKEFELEKGSLTGKYNVTQCIFSLKQIGWRDKIEEKDNTAINILSDMLAEMKGKANECTDTDKQAE